MVLRLFSSIVHYFHSPHPIIHFHRALSPQAALFAVGKVLDEMEAAGQHRMPVFVSGTIVDMSGRTLSGQTGEAFYVSIRHAKPFAVGLNCALGAPQMKPFLKRLADEAECYVLSYPNAGLPNQFGGYDDTPEDMARDVVSVVFSWNFLRNTHTSD